jgi:hypothetical protein
MSPQQRAQVNRGDEKGRCLAVIPLLGWLFRRKKRSSSELMAKLGVALLRGFQAVGLSDF